MNRGIVMVNNVLVEDPRSIHAIHGINNKWNFVEGDNFCDSIVAYMEDGNTPWFAIVKDNEVARRINSRYVETIVYS